ncbi:hypothetical protein HPB50_011038 [Hyalomma asiaticum]|uniref:Uncharacterized protein n=1 Tax=Hyalomma asiaticum TaxID=266040 RepID=A0ACB7RKA4_HYAAI|nr:hypothetical protein HPB50_011038 [Hyalomma asiaticum]
MAATITTTDATTWFRSHSFATQATHSLARNTKRDRELGSRSPRNRRRPANLHLSAHRTLADDDSEKPGVRNGGYGVGGNWRRAAEMPARFT